MYGYIQTQKKQYLSLLVLRIIMVVRERNLFWDCILSCQYKWQLYNKSPPSKKRTSQALINQFLSTFWFEFLCLYSFFHFVSPFYILSKPFTLKHFLPFAKINQSNSKVLGVITIPLLHPHDLWYISFIDYYG